jgi:hypothetical protein
MLVGHSHVARGLLFMSINLSHKDDLIPIDLIHRKAIHVTRHGHIEWSFGGMWVSVVDVVAENFVVEGVVEGGEKLLVERFEDLGFDVGRVDALEGSVEHLEQDRVVALVEGVHALYTHAVDDFQFGEGVGFRQCPLQVPVAVDDEVLFISECVGIYRT